MSKYIDLTLALNKLWRLCEEDIDAEIPEAFDFSRAREALLDLPTIEVSEDCISREYLKSFEYINKGDFNSVETIGEWIDNAPSVVPKPKEGAWITACNSYEIICSNCESEAFSEDGEYVKTNFCPNCGARMRG